MYVSNYKPTDTKVIEDNLLQLLDIGRWFHQNDDIRVLPKYLANHQN